MGITVILNSYTKLRYRFITSNVVPLHSNSLQSFKSNIDDNLGTTEPIKKTKAH